MGFFSKLFGNEDVVDEYLTGYETGYLLREEHPELSESSLKNEMFQAHLQVEAEREHGYNEASDNPNAFGNGVYDGIVRNEIQLPEVERPWWKIW